MKLNMKCVKRNRNVSTPILVNVKITISAEHVQEFTTKMILCCKTCKRIDVRSINTSYKIATHYLVTSGLRV